MYVRFVLGTVEAMVRAVVASCGSEERIIDEERFSGTFGGDSDGIVSVIVGTLLVLPYSGTEDGSP